MKTGAWGHLLIWGALMIGSANANAEARSASHPQIENVTSPASHAATHNNQTTTASTISDMGNAAVARLTPPNVLENPKLRRLRKTEISQAMLDAAARFLRHHYAEPVGTQVELHIDGKRLYARIERHYHPEGGPLKPWGFHPGVSLFCER